MHNFNLTYLWHGIVARAPAPLPPDTMINTAPEAIASSSGKTTSVVVSCLMCYFADSGAIDFDEFIAVMAAFMPTDEGEQLRQA